MAESNDISKIIGIIMEHPEIIESIRSLAEGSANDDSPTNKDEPSNEEKQEEEASVETVAAPEDDTYRLKNERKRRHELLCALKPYLSKRRSSAIDTVLSVMDILDVVKRG